MCPDRIELTLPDDERLARVARVVVGGLSARLNASYQSLDDVQLAVESVLSEWRDPCSATTTVAIDVRDGGLAIAIGPVRARAVARSAGSRKVGVAAVLSTVVETHRLVQRGKEHWLLLEKRMREIDP